MTSTNTQRVGRFSSALARKRDRIIDVLLDVSVAGFCAAAAVPVVGHMVLELAVGMPAVVDQARFVGAY